MSWCLGCDVGFDTNVDRVYGGRGCYPVDTSPCRPRPSSQPTVFHLSTRKPRKLCLAYRFYGRQETEPQRLDFHESNRERRESGMLLNFVSLITLCLTWVVIFLQLTRERNTPAR